MSTLSVNRQLLRSFDPTRAVLIMGAVMLAHATFTKVANTVADRFLQNYQRPLSAFAMSVSSVVVIRILFKDIPTIQGNLAMYSVAYAMASIFAFIFARSSGEGVLSQVPNYMIDMLEEAKIKLAEEAKANPGKKYVPLKGYEDAVHEIKVMMHCNAKTNIIILGKPGVGKSCIWERIVDNIAHGVYMEGDEDAFFSRFKFIKVDVYSLLGGTQFRGDLEKRVKKMVSMAKKDPSIIYVIDEIHALIGAGVGVRETNLDIPTMLLGPMARGEIRIWGASTFDDYQRFIKTGSAFARRLFRVDIQEPDTQQCYDMLSHRYSTMEQRGIKVSNEAIRAAIFFADRDIPDRCFPDKAIDEIEYARGEVLAAVKPDHGITLGVLEIAAAHIAHVTDQRRKRILTVESLILQFQEHDATTFRSLSDACSETSLLSPSIF